MFFVQCCRTTWHSKKSFNTGDWIQVIEPWIDEFFKKSRHLNELSYNGIEMHNCIAHMLLAANIAQKLFAIRRLQVRCKERKNCSRHRMRDFWQGNVLVIGPKVYELHIELNYNHWITVAERDRCATICVQRTCRPVQDCKSIRFQDNHFDQSSCWSSSVCWHASNNND